ncbi:cytochrome c oxidase subunit IV [Knoellia remsis]|uniref:Cytochrome c oxidase polypeptide 4 n=1 Tax=Knoellia remsis TaxID=407159 RepID=A0A2T0UXK6_9MICO|nr:cytochrome c oxidase subunit 4 [Knoellia remsis]PRY62665.1 cytochrome c oxidase subunit IV [Knoellia remsis]
MLAMERIGYLFGGFAALMAVIYGFWNDWSEPIGVVGLTMGALMGFMMAGYLAITRRKLDGVPPEDDPLGQIDDIAGEYGFFSPHSWWPFWLALACAIIFLGLAIGWWLVAVGVFFVIPATVGWVFEYWKGPRAL